jgi:hypothetical protein
MNREGSELESIPALADGNPSDPRDPPNGWCFGLSHPYIQRLIFLAGALEQETSSETITGLRPANCQGEPASCEPVRD